MNNANQDGHFWMFNPVTSRYELRWEPIPSVYSPPKYFSDIQCYCYRYNYDVPISVIIGIHGHHFKNISRLSQAPYIFYRQETHEIEIWGNQASIERAFQLLQKHILHWSQRLNQNDDQSN